MLESDRQQHIGALRRIWEILDRTQVKAEVLQCVAEDCLAVPIECACSQATSGSAMKVRRQEYRKSTNVSSRNQITLFWELSLLNKNE